MQIDVEESLIFIRQKAGGNFPPKKQCYAAEQHQEDKRDAGAPSKKRRSVNIAISDAIEKPVERAEESRDESVLYFRGRSKSAHKAGLSVSALKAESNTETAMVTANC